MAKSSPYLMRPERDAYRGSLWTSAEAASAFRVGVSSIKRWTDEGELESVRTPGGHRRYTLESLHRFAALRGLTSHLLPDLTHLDVPIPPPADVTLFDALARGDAEAVRALVRPRADSLAKQATFFDRVVGDALREIGYRWERGQLGVEQEHRASHMIAEALDRLRPAGQIGGKLALLACPPDEWHELPLRLVRLVLEWSGWNTEMAGGSLPWRSALAAMERSNPAMVAFSARSSEPFLQPDFDRLVEHCNARGTRVVVGGEWARGGTGAVDSYLRFRTLRGFERWLRSQ